MAERYMIGTYPVPDWCKNHLSCYRKQDGTTGIEFHGSTHDINLNAGDVLIRHRNYIKIQRKGDADGRGRISSTNRKN